MTRTDRRRLARYYCFISKNVFYAISVFCLLSELEGSTIVSQRVQYSAVDKAADATFRIATISEVPVIQVCLISCSQARDCQSVLYEGRTCQLYNSTVASSTIKSGQQAIAVNSRTVIYGKIIYNFA